MTLKLRAPIKGGGGSTIDKLNLPSNLADCAESMDPLEPLSFYFPGVLDSAVHVIVDIPTRVANTPLPETNLPTQGKGIIDWTNRSSSHYVANPDIVEALSILVEFWDKLWKRQEDPFGQEHVIRDNKPLTDVHVPTLMKVLRGLPCFLTRTGILIRTEYEEARDMVNDWKRKDKYKALVIIGRHPGIGKTCFLYYLLTESLLKREPVVFQFFPDTVFLFNSKGVSTIPTMVATRPEFDGMLALVDSSYALVKPAPIFLGKACPFFVVMAGLPPPSRREPVKHYWRFTEWNLNPFTLPELIQARQLQESEASEENIQKFFKEYGPSARDCYRHLEYLKSDQQIVTGT